MSWVIVGHPEAGTFPTEGHALAAAWRIADAAGLMTRADVIKKATPGPEGIVTVRPRDPDDWTYRRRLAAGERVKVGAVQMVSWEAMADALFLETVVRRALVEQLARAAEAEDAELVGDIVFARQDRIELNAVEFRAQSLARKVAAEDGSDDVWRPVGWSPADGGLFA